MGIKFIGHENTCICKIQVVPVVHTSIEAVGFLRGSTFSAEFNNGSIIQSGAQESSKYSSMVSTNSGKMIR